MEQHPLLTHDQLVDWLIYHCPLQDSGVTSRPFLVSYSSHKYSTNILGQHDTPWGAYYEVAHHITMDVFLHREVTDLYWYWTI